MTPQQLLAIGVRLFAVWLALTSISYFSAIPLALANTSLGTDAPTQLAYVLGAGYVLCALGLWFFPMLVAHKLLPRTTHTNHLNPQGHDLARTGCALLGLWMLSRALPTVVWLFFKAFLFVSAGSTYATLPADSKLELAVAGFEVLLGLLFLLKAKSFATMLISEAAKPDSQRDAI
jgi:hypothetical protein